ncbi:MAG: PTS sugar transporter subunit IIA [Pirellulaceae bacterium]
MSEEDFDVNSLATYLHLTPAQVEKMASRDQLPGRRIGGQWRFSKNEIHHWFEERIGLSDENELEAVEKVLDSDQRDASESLGNLLEPTAIWIPLQARTRNSVISQMCSSAADAGLVWDAGKMESAIKTRENLHPTALENGVAMLHPRRPQPNNIREAFVGLGLTSNGLPFGGPRGVLTDVFFLIASTDEKGHLQTLARLSRLIAVPEFLPALRDCTNDQQAWELVRDTDLTMA